MQNSLELYILCIDDIEDVYKINKNQLDWSCIAYEAGKSGGKKKERQAVTKKAKC